MGKPVLVGSYAKEDKWKLIIIIVHLMHLLSRRPNFYPSLRNDS